jgi:hypothetical protein
VCGGQNDEDLIGCSTTPPGWSCPDSSRARRRELIEHASDLIKSTSPPWTSIVDPPEDRDARKIVRELLLGDPRRRSGREKHELQAEVLAEGPRWAARRSSSH